MSIIRFFARLIGVILAALVGNWVGDQMRARATGEKGHQFQVTHAPEGETSVTINPNLTNVGPAVLAGLLLRPHVIWAFLGGVLASGLLGEKYEKSTGEWIKSKMPAEGQSPAGWIKSKMPEGSQSPTEWIKKKLPSRKPQEGE
jgi:hypothetical protein